MSWSNEDEVPEAVKPATAATQLPDSAQVTSEHFMSPRLPGSDFRTTSNSIDSKPTATWSDTQMRLRLDTARVLRRAVQQQFQARPKATPKDWAGTGVLKRLQKKVAVTESLFRSLHARIEATDRLTVKVKQAVKQLEREQQSLEEPAILCERRLLIRERRPSGEDVEDDFQAALLSEREVLEQSSKMLSAYMDAGIELLEALQAAKSEMVDDIQFKRHALRLEKSALQFDAFHGKDRACVLPLVAEKGGPKSGEDLSDDWKFGATFLSLEKDDWREENTANESIQRSARHTNELITRTSELEQNGAKFVQNAATLMQSVKGKVEHASETSHRSMQASIARLLRQKKELQIGLAESQEDMTRTELLLLHMQHEIQSQKTSLDEWATTPDISLDRLDQRLPLSVQQDIRQSALERMQEQVHNTKGNVHLLSNKCEESKDLLCKLQESYNELRELLNAKTASWRLDLQCAKLKSGKEALRSQSSARDSFVVPRPLHLSNRTLERIRSKIKAAAYEGPNGHGFDVMFNRFDQDGSGCLEPAEVKTALRRSLKIPASSVSDQQIYSLCAWLDIDGSGVIEIDELVAFLSTETVSPRLQKKLESELGAPQASDGSLELDCFVTPRRRSTGNKPGKVQPLKKSILSTIRSKMKAASYAGQLGCEVKALFSRFDHNGSGVLEEKQLRQVLRRGMRIPPTVISDEQVGKLCAMLDGGSGVVSIDALVDFVGKDEPRSRRLNETV